MVLITKKIDADTIEITETTITIIKISELESEKDTLEFIREDATESNELRDSLPEDKKKFIIEVPIPTQEEIDTLQEKIDNYKEIPLIAEAIKK